MKNTLKIAVLSIHSSPLGPAGSRDTGGMSTYLRGLSEALGAAGHRVDIFTRAAVTGSEESIFTKNIYLNVRLITLADGLGELNKYELAGHSAALAATIADYTLFEKSGYDLIFSHYWISGLVGQLLHESWNLPHLVMFHTIGWVKNKLCPGESEPAQRLAAEEKLAATADLLVVAAESEKERLVNYYGLARDRVALIPCGINRNLFRPLDRSKARKYCGFGDEKIILAVGRLVPVKGFDLLLLAAALLPETINFKVVIVGGDQADADREEELITLASGLGLAGKVVLAGRVEHGNLPLYYNAADLTAIPSWYESFSLVALESLACGTPLVAGLVGVIPELLKEGRSNDYIFPVANREPETWAAEIGKALKAIPPRQDLRTTGNVLAAYSWPTAARLLAEAGHRLLKNEL